ncbi:MAG: hypothetical protein A2Y12_06300 [Planctomycetes bacterium GWF2_42_9]|nr:MAG: hypothetical protein A2Y12_06300 [Planctomycetes bacterium GWF2_42_9]
MKNRKYPKVSVLIVLATIQTIALNAAWPAISGFLGLDSASNMTLAYETPEPGTILLLGLGGFALLKKKYRKN